jgi:carboxyl-terminal processing protease
MSRRNLYLMLGCLTFALLCYKRGGQDPYARYLLEGYEKIDRYALEDVPDEELFEGAMEGMVNVLHKRGDTYSEFLAPQVAKRMGEELSQEFGGIGVVIEFRDDPRGFFVAQPPLPGRPADKAGIRRGDQIVAIDGKPLEDLGRDDFGVVLQRMRGKPRKPLELTIRKPDSDTPQRVAIVRELIGQPSIAGDVSTGPQTWEYLLDDDRRIALLRLMSFGDKTASEIEELLPKLKAEGMQGLILDVRQNPGGRLDSAVDVCQLFLPAGVLIYETRGRGNEVLEQVYSTRNGPFIDLPLVVLIDRDSASASELVAGCLKDTGRAVVGGERSFGKGTVQQLLYMQSGNRMLKLTSATFWTKGGTPIHQWPGAAQWGVTPTAGLEVERTAEEFEAWIRARRQRDMSAFLEAEPKESDSQPNALFRDEAVDRAVAHLQHELESP